MTGVGVRPAPDSVWQPTDRREADRRVRVLRVELRAAPRREWVVVIALVDRRGRPARGHERAQRAEPGRITRVRLDRWHTAYRPTPDGQGR